MNYNKNNKKVLWGLILITVATLMFLSTFSLLPDGFISLGISYTLLAYGLYSLIKSEFYSGLFALGFGFKISPAILAPGLDFNQIGWFMLILITLIFATGLETLFGKKFSWKKMYKNGKVSGFEFSDSKKNEKYKEDLFKEYIMVNLNMGQTSRYIDSKRIDDKIAGLIIGKVTLNIVFHFGVFKIVAASSKFESIFLKIPPIKI